MKKPGFMLYIDDLKVLEYLEGDDFKAVIIELSRIANGEDHVELFEPAAEIAFSFMAQSVFDPDDA